MWLLSFAVFLGIDFYLLCMKLVTILICVVALPSTVRADTSHDKGFSQGNDLLSNAVTTLLQDTRGKSSNDDVVRTEGIPLKDTSSDAIRTSFKKTSVVRSGTKTYVAGLRTTAAGTNFCSASLISPLHLLVGTYCMLNDIRWASIGSHYVNGTQDGEQIKVVAILNHPNSSNTNNFINDFAVLVLQRPSTFKPVTLSKADDSDVTDGGWAIKMGWDDTGGVGTMAYELMRADVQLMSNSDCIKKTAVSESKLCSRGAANEISCIGDYGGPVVVERSSGDVMVGVVSWGNDCSKPGYPSIYSRVSSARAWIESVTSQCIRPNTGQ